MAGCPCQSDLNFIVCRPESCGWSGRLIDATPFIAGAVAILVAGGVTQFMTDRLLNRGVATEADTSDFANFISESAGLVTSLLVFVIGFIAIASADNLPAIAILVGIIIILPLGWLIWRFVSKDDPIKIVRKKKDRALGWRSYMMTIANLGAVILVFLVI